MSSVWYLSRDGRQHGPIFEAEFAEFVKRGHLRPDDYIWEVGSSDWLLGKDLLSLSQHGVVSPPPPVEGNRASPR